jgi:hypothetical protein
MKSAFAMRSALAIKQLLGQSSPSLFVRLGVALLMTATFCEANDLRGTFGFDSQLFTGSPAFVNQDNSRWHFSGYASVDWAGDIGDSSAFTLNLFARAAPHADDEFFGDIRDATLSFNGGDTEFKAGVLSETWGVLEAWNPVDIVNQRDMVEDFQGDAKLGQPGLEITTRKDDLVLSFIALTYARERRIAEGEDRLRALPERVRSADFEDGRFAPSFAARAQYRIGDLDLAVSQFWGHARDPLYTPIINANGLVGFDAYYQRIAQTGLEAQYVIGDSVLKSETIYQTGGVDSFIGGGVGFESTFSRLAGGGSSVTVYAEFYRDTRSREAPLTPFQEDAFIGARYNLNDTSDTVFEVRCTHDLEWHSNLVDLRAQRRLEGVGVISAQIILPLQVKRDPALQGFENDKYLKLGLAWYF